MVMLVDTRKLSIKPSGIGMYIYQYMKYLHKYTKISLLLVTDVMESKEIREIAFFCTEQYIYGKKVNYSGKIFGYFLFIQQLIKKVKPDIFWEPNNVVPMKLKNPYGKIMLTVHDIFPITHPQYHKFLFCLYYKYTLKKSLKQSDILTFVSNVTKKEVSTYYRKKIEKKQTAVTYNIAELEFHKSIEDENYFLYIGNLEQRKGVDILLDAYALYIQGGGAKKLYLAGQLRDMGLKKKINEIKAKTNKINYLGYIEAEKKKTLLEKCSCLIFPSRAEGFGITPMEALTYGKPVIVSDLDIFSEILGNKKLMFHLTKNDAQNIENLKRKMEEPLYYPPEKMCREVLHKYEPVICIQNFVKQLDLMRELI